MKVGDGPDDRSRDAAAENDAPAVTSGTEPAEPAESAKSAGAFCNECGWRNPPGANFCSRCGTKLQQVFSESAGRAGLTERAGSAASDGPRSTGRAASQTAESLASQTTGSAASVTGGADVRSSATSEAASVPAPPPETNVPEGDGAASTAGMGRQVVIIVGAGILFVIALYMITVMSAQNNRTSGPTARSTPAATVEEPPLAEQFRPRETELQEQIQEANGSEALDIRRDLIDLYLAANRLDLAAAEAERLAEGTNTENDWAVAGNLYYDVMESREDASRGAYARRAISAYDRALAINPDNLDIRTDMAIAYMYDPDNPMMAIQETNRVLEQDSLHIQANFNRGVMLANINRIDQAIDQFEKVKRIVGDESSPIYQRADQAIESVRGAAR